MSENLRSDFVAVSKMAPHVKVQQRLIEKGFEAYLVGGCVRDRLLGRQPKDYDITTNALPEQVQAIFGYTVPVGAKFGVVVVVKDNTQVEVATYRADGAYTDGRRPDEVKFSASAKEDVIRRDFTMNGLLLKADYSVFDENGIVDYVGGVEDIKHRTIRAIGDPNVRFAEDALRMLRACRFAAQLNFKIEAGTLAAIEKNARLLRVISAERVAAELFKIFTTPHPLKGLVPFFATGLARYALPESFGRTSLFTFTMQRFKQFSAAKDPLLGMAMFLADAPPSESHVMAHFLKLSNEQKEQLVNARQVHLPTFQASMRGEFVPLSRMKRMARRSGMEIALELFIQDEVIGKTNFGFEAVMELVRQYRALTPEEIRPVPIVTGQDLINMGLKPGPHFSEILTDIETGQLEGTLTREAAIEHVKAHTYVDGQGEVVYNRIK
jgi:poly(A) polymerase